MEKTPNSSAPTLKLVNGPAGRDKRAPRTWKEISRWAPRSWKESSALLKRELDEVSGIDALGRRQARRGLVAGMSYRES